MYRLVADHEFLTNEIELDEVTKLVDESTDPVHIYESVALWEGEEPLYKTFFHTDTIEDLIDHAESNMENEGYLHHKGVIFNVDGRDVDPAMSDYNRMIDEWAAKWIKPHDVNKLWKKSDLLLPGNRCHNCKLCRGYGGLLLCTKENLRGTWQPVPNNFTCKMWETKEE